MLFWETTVRCNLACAHCRRLESNAAGVADLSTSQGESLIDQLAELGRRQPQMPVLVFSGGEPFCRRDLFKLMAKARQEGIILALATNGTTVSREKAQQIRDSGVARVSVSLDGATAEVHDRMRQIPGAFDRAIEGIGHLHDAGVPFQINVTLTKQNVHQLEDVYGLAKSLGAVAVHIFMLVPVGCGQVLAETDMLSPPQYEQIMQDICALENRGEIQIKVTCGPHYERVKRQSGHPPGGSGPPQTHNNSAFGDPNVKAEGLGDGSTASGTGPRQAVLGAATHHSPQSKGCLAGLGVLFVSHRGDVYPCGYLPVNCGNILERRLIEIWDSSEDLARMRDVAALEGKCGICGYKQVCGGCRARAFGMTGNYMGEEPFCAYDPRAATPERTR
jgi:radical SAM protein with 4Fe4S-binding SPASM domain